MNYFSDLGNNVVKINGFEQIKDHFYISDQLHNGITISPVYPDSPIAHILVNVDEHRCSESHELYYMIKKNKIFKKSFTYLKHINRYVLPVE